MMPPEAQVSVRVSALCCLLIAVKIVMWELSYFLLPQYQMLRQQDKPFSRFFFDRSHPVVYQSIYDSLKTQHMYITTVMKYQLHQSYMFRP